MNALPHQLDTYQFDCQACEGSGVIVSVVHITGEAYDADLSETRCDACQGKCFLVLCEYCDAEVVDGHCADCEVAL